MTPVNLPGQLTPFVGRVNELDEIKARLTRPDCRLLTLTGTGGTGKTRLAVEAARTVIDHFPDGLYFVNLESLSTPEFIFTATAEAMDFPLYSGSDRETQLLAFLQDKTALLVLDNFEHLLDGAELVSRMLHASPDLKVMVTSRERLNLQEEWLYDVHGLPFPDETATGIDTYSAVQLFTESARRINPGFSLNSEAAAVARICRLVEGMPLAIELASSWGRVLTYDEIAREIARGIDILETETRNIPARHRSMRAVMDRSWQHLSETERQAIRHLAVFRGGFTREAAAAVIQANPRLLATLVNKSWLRHEIGSERYSIHELVRQYALDQLSDGNQAIIAQDNHCTYFTEFMHRREYDIKHGRQIEALLEIERDFENVRMAWNYAISQRDDDRLCRMMEALNFYCDMKARFSEGEELFRTAAEIYAASDATGDHLMYIALRARRVRMVVLGSLLISENYSDFRKETDAGLEFARLHASPEDLAFQYYVSAIVASTMADSLKFSQESARIYQSLGDEFYYADLRTWEAVCSSQWQESKLIYQEMSAIQRRIGDLNGLSWSLQHLSRQAFWEHRFDDADRYLNEAVAIQRQRGDLKGLYWSKMSLSQRKFLMGDFETARTYAMEALRIATNLKLILLNQAALATLGLIAIVTEKNIDEGKRLCQDALNIDTELHGDAFDGPLDALVGLIIAAWGERDGEAIRQYYDRLNQALNTFEITHPDNQFLRLALPAALTLSQLGETSRAVEILSKIEHIPDETEYPVITWITKLPWIGRLQTELREQLGETRYEAAWARGAAMQIEELTSQIRHGLLSDQEAAPALQDALTGRELEILHLAAQGLSNNQIAQQLVLSAGTVKWYLSEIYSKLAVSNRAHAIARAHELHLIHA